MENLDSPPNQNKPPPLISTWSVEEKHGWLKSIGQQFLEGYVKKGIYILTESYQYLKIVATILYVFVVHHYECSNIIFNFFFKIDFSKSDYMPLVIQ